MKKFRITINGRAYEVEAEVLSDGPAVVTSIASQSAAISAAEVAPAPKKSAPKATGASGDVLSPLAGKVVSIDVKPGTAVTEGQKLITLEAMKMNTFVISPATGTLKEILVTAGQAVAEGDLLARVE